KALRKMGAAARPAVAALTRVAAEDPDADVRRAAKETLSSIQGERAARPAAEPSLVGTWEGMLTYNHYGFKLSLKVQTTFKADGTYLTVYHMEDYVFSEKGEYTFGEGILTTSPEGGLGGVSLSAQATITWVNDNEFQYKGSGFRSTFRRK